MNNEKLKQAEDLLIKAHTNVRQAQNSSRVVLESRQVWLRDAMKETLEALALMIGADR